MHYLVSQTTLAKTEIQIDNNHRYTDLAVTEMKRSIISKYDQKGNCQHQQIHNC